MNIREITPDMDDEDQNVAHSQNALEYFKAGMLDEAKAELALDRGFHGTFDQWQAWAEKTIARREAEEEANNLISHLWA